jgi:hypothetical protein
VTAHYRLTTGSAPPQISHKLKLGSTIIGQVGPGSLTASQTNAQTSVAWLLQAIAPLSALSGIECALLTVPNGVGATNDSVTAMPVNVATNDALALKVSTLWGSAGTGVNQVKLSQLIIEALN